MAAVKADGAPGAYIHAAVCQAAPAGICYFKAAHGAFIAGHVDDLDNIGIIPVAAGGHAHPFGQNSPFLIDAAVRSLTAIGGNALGNIRRVIQKGVGPGLPGHLPQHQILGVLDIGIELSHNMGTFRLL